MTKNLPILLFAGILLLAPIAMAYGVTIENPLRANTFEELVDSIITFIFNIALVVAPIMIIMAGFIFVTSGGNPRGVQQAKDILIYTVVGFFVIMISRGFITMIRGLF